MPTFTFKPIQSALYGFDLAGTEYIVAPAAAAAAAGAVAVGTVIRRGAAKIIGWGFRKVTSQKFIVEQILGGLGLSKIATTELADPDIAYNPSTGLILIAGAQYYADPPPPLPRGGSASVAL